MDHAPGAVSGAVELPRGLSGQLVGWSWPCPRGRACSRRLSATLAVLDDCLRRLSCAADETAPVSLQLSLLLIQATNLVHAAFADAYLMQR